VPLIHLLQMQMQYSISSEGFTVPVLVPGVSR